MPRMTLLNFDEELVARGFDSFTPDTRTRYINWGYRRIARRARWLWEQTKATGIGLGPTQYGIGAFDEPIDASHPIGNMKSITKVYITDPANRRAKLRPLSDDEFFEQWLILDLTDAQNQGIPSGYYWFSDLLYILPPPSESLIFEVHYKRQVTELVNNSDFPITPPDLDEAILTAALVRCHKRANELQLSQVNAGELEEVFSDMATDETFLEEEQPSRVSPDDTWL